MRYQAFSRRKIGQWINFFAAPAAKNAAPQQEKRHVRSQACRQAETGLRIQPVPCEAFKAHDGGGGIAAASPQAAPRRDALLKPDADASFKFPCCAPNLTGAVNQVVTTHRNRILTIQYDAGAASDRKIQAVMHGHSLIDGSDFVVTVRARKENLEAEVDFREGAESNTVAHGDNCELAGKHLARISSLPG